MPRDLHPTREARAAPPNVWVNTFTEVAFEIRLNSRSAKWQRRRMDDCVRRRAPRLSAKSAHLSFQDILALDPSPNHVSRSFRERFDPLAECVELAGQVINIRSRAANHSAQID